MPGPFEHDGDADDRLQQELKEEIDRQEAPGPTGDDDLEIDISGSRDEAFDLDPDPDRASKKANRFKEVQRQAEEEREKRMQAEARAAALEAIQRTQAGAMPRQPAEDPLQRDIDENYTRRQDLATRYNERVTSGTLTESDREAITKQARELEEKGQRLMYQKVAAEERASKDPREENIRMLRLQYPDVGNDSSAWAWADGRARQLLARGREYNPELISEVMEETRREFRMGSHKNHAPRDEGTRRALAAPSRGGGPRSDSGPGKVRMTPEMRRMADMAYPSIKDAKKRYTHWAKTSGAAFQKMERDAGR